MSLCNALFMNDPVRKAVYLSKHLRATLDKIAEDNQRSRASVIKLLLKQGLVIGEPIGYETEGGGKIILGEVPEGITQGLTFVLDKKLFDSVEGFQKQWSTPAKPLSFSKAARMLLWAAIRAPQEES